MKIFKSWKIKNFNNIIPINFTKSKYKSTNIEFIINKIFLKTSHFRFSNDFNNNKSKSFIKGIKTIEK